MTSYSSGTSNQDAQWLLPCAPGKTPLIKNWREQSSNDPEIIKQWASTNGVILAIDCAKNNYVVVDVDAHDGSPNGHVLWNQLVAKFGLPPDTPIVQTPNGGLHFYFSQPENERFGCSAGEFKGKGVDVRGDGGLVIAPGAMLPDGRGWFYAPSSPDLSVRPPVVPEWIAAKIRRGAYEATCEQRATTTTTPYGGVVLKDICAEIASAEPGTQSNALVAGSTRIGSLASGGEIEEGHAISRLIEAGLMMRNGNSHHPWTRKVVEDQVRRAFNAGKKSPSTAPNRNLASIDLSNVKVGGKPLNFSAAAQSENSRYKLLNSAEIERLPISEWRVKPVFPDQGVCAIYGASTSGKSFLALDLAASIATGAGWFGYRVKPTLVAYVVLEGEGGLKLRVEALQQSKSGPLPATFRLVINQSFNLALPGDVTDLAASIMAAGATRPVIVIDTFNKAAPGLDENSSKDMGLILQGAKTLQALTGGLVILVHHTGKDATKGLRGHSSLPAALDAAIEVTRYGDQRTFRTTKSKDGIDGGEKHFQLKVIELGTDEDGDSITSCVVEPANDAGAKATPKHQLRGANRIALDSLRECRDVAFPPPQEVLDALPTVRGKPLYAPSAVVPEGAWRDRCYAKGISTADQDAKKKAFSRSRKALLDMGLVHVSADHYWVDNWREQDFVSNKEKAV